MSDRRSQTVFHDTLRRLLSTRSRIRARVPRLNDLCKIVKETHANFEQTGRLVQVTELVPTGRYHYVLQLMGTKKRVYLTRTDIESVDWESRLMPTSIIETIVTESNSTIEMTKEEWTAYADNRFADAISMWRTVAPGAVSLRSEKQK